MIIQGIRKYFSIFVVVFFAAVFFVSTSYFNYRTQEFQKTNGEGVDFVKWASPDETANYVFSKFYSQENDLKIYEKYNIVASDIMHPRSFRSDQGEIKPVSFLGIILIYGTIAKIFSYRIIPFLTPFFASIGLIYFYLFIKELFGKKNALMSFFILVFFPPYVYYSVRSMFHNVLFVVLLLIGLYYGFKMTRDKSENVGFFDLKKVNWVAMIMSALSGFFIGLAAIARTSELMWIVPILCILWIFNIKKIGFTKVLVFLSFFFLAILPILYYNQILYSSPILGGYAEMNNSIVTIKDTTTELAKSAAVGSFHEIPNFLDVIKRAIFYFGIHPRQSLKVFDYYFVSMFPWLFYLSMSGLFFLFFNLRNKIKRYLLYIFTWGLSSGILVLYYGSWIFYDNPDPSRHTIGNSYTRYWLPMYMCAIPLAIFAVNFFIRKSGKVLPKNFRLPVDWLMRFLFIGVIGFFSIRFLLIGSEEGLVYLYQKNLKMRTEWEELIRSTENNSVLITRYHDKLLFPERKVINGDFSDKNMRLIYSEVAALLPVYYYNFSLSEKDLEYLNSRRLSEVGLKITPLKKITEDFTLYRISKNNF